MEDMVAWAGFGLPSNPAAGAPAGTNVSSLDAFALFANGTASVPGNMQARQRLRCGAHGVRARAGGIESEEANASDETSASE